MKSKVRYRVVKFSEIVECPDKRLDAKHYIPKHKKHHKGGDFIGLNLSKEVKKAKRRL